jgi:TPR repeat protein
MNQIVFKIKEHYSLVIFTVVGALTLCLCGCGDQTSVAPTQDQARASSEGKLDALTKRAEAGDKDAQFELGSMYLEVKNVPSIQDKAYEWIRKAAEQGHAEAQFVIGNGYTTGKLRETDIGKSIDTATAWYEKAALQGHAEAQFIMGEHFGGNVLQHMRDPNKKWDDKKALEWYEMAAVQNHVLAQVTTATRYKYGVGAPINLVRAAKWYLAAAELGDATAQNEIGLAYENGRGVSKDTSASAKWFLASAAQGDPDAQFFIALKYYYGVGLVKDFVRAYAWSSLAVLRGNKVANKLNAEVDMKLTKDQRAIGQGLAANWKYGDDFSPPGNGGVAQQRAAAEISKRGTGTAFLVNNSGQAITNHHVIDGCKEVRAEGREGTVTIKTTDAMSDLALLQFPGVINAVAVINSEQGKTRQGDDILVFGYPLNSVLSAGGNLTPGIVSALSGLNNNTSQLQITAPIQPGSSGSPVMNKKGEVVGVVSMKLSDSKMAKATGSVGQNVNFAVSGQTLKAFLDAHKVEYSTGGLISFNKSTADIADEARKWTMVVECWK